MTIRSWWNSKTDQKRQNWLMLAVALCFIAGGFVEQYTWIALIGAIPGIVMVWMEVKRK